MLNYIWMNTWELRQAIRSALNGYDITTVALMGLIALKEIKYRKH